MSHARLVPLQLSIATHFNDGIGKSLRRFLREVVADAATNEAMLVLAREFPGIETWVQMGRAIGIAFKCDGGHGDDRTCCKTLVQISIFRLAFCQAKAPAIVVDHDINVIRLVECGGTTVERRIIEFPQRGCKLPNELRKVVARFAVTCPAGPSGEQ